MKKLLYIFATIVLCIPVGSCGLIADPVSTNDTDSLTLDSLIVEELEFTVNRITFSDSLEHDGNMMHYDVTMDVPVTGPGPLVDAVKKWLDNILGGTYDEALTFDDDMMRHYAAEYFDENAFSYGPESVMACYMYIDIVMTDNTEGFVSYEVDGEDFTGGAHGMLFTYGATFVKADGRQLGWEMFPDTTNLAGLFKKYLASDWAAKNDLVLDEVLFEDAASNFPLPYQDPWLVTDGVKFCYNVYEIASFAVGMSSAVIPTEEAKKYLDPQVYEVLNKK